MIPVADFNILSSTLQQIPLSKGTIKGLAISFEGVNNNGQTLTLANMGDIRLKRGAEVVWEFTLSRMYYHLAQRYPGATRFTSTDNSTAQVFLNIPMRVNKHDGNVARLDSNYTLEFSHASLATVLASGTVTVLYDHDMGTAKYIPQYKNFSIRALSGVVSPDDISQQNLAGILVDYSANHTRFRLIKDGNYLVDLTAQQMAFVMNSAQESQTYAAASASNPFWINLYRNASLIPVAGKDYMFGVVSTDTSVNGMFITLEFSDARLAITNQTLRNATAKAKQINPEGATAVTL